MSLDDIAKKHNVSVDTLKTELDKAIETELEHTDDREVAKEIAMDHLSEASDYYQKLAVAEDEVTEPDINERFAKLEKSFEEKTNKALAAYEEKFNAKYKELEDENTELKRTQPMGNFTPKPNEGLLRKAEKRDELSIKYKAQNQTKSVV